MIVNSKFGFDCSIKANEDAANSGINITLQKISWAIAVMFTSIVVIWLLMSFIALMKYLI